MFNEEGGKTRLETEERPNESLCRLSSSLICYESGLLAWDELKMRVKTTQPPGLRGEGREREVRGRRGEEKREARRGEEEWDLASSLSLFRSLLCTALILN